MKNVTVAVEINRECRFNATQLQCKKSYQDFSKPFEQMKIFISQSHLQKIYNSTVSRKTKENGHMYFLITCKEDQFDNARVEVGDILCNVN